MKKEIVLFLMCIMMIILLPLAIQEEISNNKIRNKNILLEKCTRTETIVEGYISAYNLPCFMSSVEGELITYVKGDIVVHIPSENSKTELIIHCGDDWEKYYSYVQRLGEKVDVLKIEYMYEGQVIKTEYELIE